MVQQPKRKVVIIGGGFGGMNAAKRLGKCARCQVTLIDRRNHHLFQPLLYQVAMAGLDPSDIASPIRSMVQRFANTSTLLAEVQGIDLNSHSVWVPSGELRYDYLILACGAMQDYFGHTDWRPHAPGLKSIPDAIDIRRRVLTAFERAEQTADEQERRRQLTFVFVGGGPTGVELAGAIAELAKKTLRSDFRNIDAASARILLLEGGERLLSDFPKPQSDYAKHALESLGVEVGLEHRVSEISADGVRIGERFIPAATVVWTAGVSPNPLVASLDVPRDRSGRLIVADDLTVPGHPEVFVIGDAALAKDENGAPLPGIAPVAIQQGRYVGDLIRGEVKTGRSRQRRPFRYHDKGKMATIGRRRAVMESGKLRLNGTIAWLAWLLVHIFYLNGLRNRVFVFLSWAWSYVTFSRGARLIVPPRRAEGEAGDPP